MPNGKDHRSWLLTWTTKGTWLPGDQRGWVLGEPNNLPDTPHEAPNEGLRIWSLKKLKGSPVWLTRDQATVVAESLLSTAKFHEWWLGALAVMANHVHLVVTVPGDPDHHMLLRQFKNFASRALNSGWGKQAWWTSSGSTRKLPDDFAVAAGMRYVIQQLGSLALHHDQLPGLADL